MHNVGPPPNTYLRLCGTIICACVCVGKRKRLGGAVGYHSPLGVVVGGIHRSLLPLSDNSGVIQARVGWAVPAS